MNKHLDGCLGNGPAIRKVGNLRSPRQRQGGENLTHMGAVANSERSPLQVVLVVSELLEVDIVVLLVIKRKEVKLPA